ncbi:MAG: NADH-quinone oxidoreductase subunit C [Rickettsiaceae bacterium]|nr:MAG: NADH-quinone oxidoreductase subunit C [Rickettsiaceae bacterium]
MINGARGEIEEFATNKFKLNKIDIANFISYSLERENLMTLLSFVNTSLTLRFSILVDLFVADFPNREQRFEVVYSLLSLKLNQRLILKIFVNEDDLVPSISSIFDNSCWYEREAFDMFGIKFDDCPDMRRILTDYGFVGHPLRKDFPLTGHLEVEYNKDTAKVAYQPIELEQEFRMFDFVSSWQGPPSSKPNIVLPGDEKAIK